MEHSIIYQNQEISFSVNINKRAKRIILRVSDEGEVAVTVPRKRLEKDAIKLVQKKAGWILAHQNRAKREIESRPKVIDEIQFLGNKYPVEILTASKVKLKFLTNKFELHLGDHNYETVRQELKKWYTKRAKEIIPNLIQNFGCSDRIRRITIRGQKTCWGSCSSKDNLNFNWRLMMAPLEVVNYIVAHELAHLEHLNHSEKFWQEVSSKCPDFRRHKYWLKQNGRLLKF